MNLFRRPQSFGRLGALLAATSAHAARCGGDFNGFVQNISAEAASAGISQG